MNFKKSYTGMFKKPSQTKSPVTLLDLINKTQPRIKPIFNKYMWHNTVKLITCLISSILVGVGTYYLAPHLAAHTLLKLVIPIGVAITGMGVLLSSLFLLVSPFEWYNFRKNQPISIDDKSANLFKLTPQEIQELMEIELEPHQCQLLEEIIEMKGQVIYKDLIEINESAKQLDDYKQIEILKQNNKENFYKENGLLIESEEAEWGATKPLNKWL